VWAEVGSDAITENLNTGWVTNFNAGQIAQVAVKLPQGYSTVYFPVIKVQVNQTGSPYASGTQFSMKWVGGPQPCNFGYGDVSEFADSKDIEFMYLENNSGGITWTQISPKQRVISAMVYPVVCWASQERWVTVQLWRNLSGGRLAFGRPVVLPQACSWFTTQ
jgi:hypothetical protein